MRAHTARLIAYRDVPSIGITMVVELRRTNLAHIVFDRGLRSFHLDATFYAGRSTLERSRTGVHRVFQTRYVLSRGISISSRISLDPSN